MADHHGTAGALSTALTEAKAGLSGEAEQLDLLAAENRPSVERLRYDAPALVAEAERTRKAGRPKGAQNLATQDLKRWLVQLLGRTPQEWRVRWLMIEPEQVAKRFGMTPKEALEFQDRIARDLQPYFMAAMQPVDDQGRPVPLVALSIGGRVGNANGAAPWAEWFQEERPDVVDVTPETSE